MTDKLRLYADARAFRRALEDRLKQKSKAEGMDFQRLMREVAFDRFLARLFIRESSPWILKGGYALELRIKEARATKDIDLALRQALGRESGVSLDAAIFEELAKAAAHDLGDFFSFEIGEAMQDLPGAPYGGARYPVESRLDDRTFVRFHVDVGAGDVLLTPFDLTQGHDWLEFAGIHSPHFTTVNQEQHFAEKVHAYTLPRDTPNSRSRDLVDMLLLIGSEKMNRAKVQEALDATFKRRESHPLPAALKPPPKEWTEPYARMARECGVADTLSEAFDILSRYFSGMQ
jgi:hypothetical protein